MEQITDTDQLARLIDLCERKVGDGWIADPTAGKPRLTVCGEYAPPRPGRGDGPGVADPLTRAEWMNLGNRAAARLLFLMNRE